MNADQKQHNARLRVGLTKCAETLEHLATLIKNPARREAIVQRLESIKQRAKEV